MEDVRGKYVSPAIDQLAFNCPHCGALAKQFWFSVRADQLEADHTPHVITADLVSGLRESDMEREERERTVKWAERIATGRPTLERVSHRSAYFDVPNVSLSRCYNCDEVCVWIYDQLFWPRRPGGPQPTSIFRVTCGVITRRQAQY
jgi:hypothetical protein